MDSSEDENVEQPWDYPDDPTNPRLRESFLECFSFFSASDETWTTSSVLFPREFDEMAVTLIPEPGDELLEDIQTSTETPLSDQANQLTAQTPESGNPTIACDVVDFKQTITCDGVDFKQPTAVTAVTEAPVKTVLPYPPSPVEWEEAERLETKSNRSSESELMMSAEGQVLLNRINCPLKQDSNIAHMKRQLETGKRQLQAAKSELNFLLQRKQDGQQAQQEEVKTAIKAPAVPPKLDSFLFSTPQEVADELLADLDDANMYLDQLEKELAELKEQLHTYAPVELVTIPLDLILEEVCEEDLPDVRKKLEDLEKFNQTYKYPLKLEVKTASVFNLRLNIWDKAHMDGIKSEEQAQDASLRHTEAFGCNFEEARERMLDSLLHKFF